LFVPLKGSSFYDLAELFLIDMKTVLVRRRIASEDFLPEDRENLQEQFAQVEVAFGEFRSKAIEEAHPVTAIFICVLCAAVKKQR